MRFLFTCGGTAGHINPAISVAGKLRELMPDSEFLFVGAQGNMETELVPCEGYKISTINITGLRRDFSLNMLKHNAATVKNVLTATRSAKKLVSGFKPDVAMGTGGYVCYPVLSAAHSLGVPTAVHESNALPGLTTKLVSRFADKIMVGFEESREFYTNPKKIVVTGTPVRSDFFKYSREQARAELGIPEGKPLVLSVWGSLGADFMNDLIVEFIERLLHKPFFSLIHATGKRGYGKVMERLRHAGVSGLSGRGIYVKEYIYDMPAAMAAADLVLCRAGASTLSELAVLGKPAVLVPSPNVTNNHQERNAAVLERAGAARVLTERGLTVETLLARVSELLEPSDALTNMSQEMKRSGRGDASGRIAEIALELALRM